MKNNTLLTALIALIIGLALGVIAAPRFAPGMMDGGMMGHDMSKMGGDMPGMTGMGTPKGDQGEASVLRLCAPPAGDIFLEGSALESVWAGDDQVLLIDSKRGGIRAGIELAEKFPDRGRPSQRGRVRQGKGRVVREEKRESDDLTLRPLLPSSCGSAPGGWRCNG